MEKCLVTRLNASVKNEDLLKLGELKMKTVDYTPSSAEFFYAKAKPGNPVTINVSNGHLTNNNGENLGISKTVSTGSYPSQYITTPGAVVSFENKYDLLSITFGASAVPAPVFDLSQIRAMVNLEEFTLSSKGQVTGNIDIFSGTPNLKSLVLRGQYGITGELSVLSKLTNLTKLDVSSSGVSGNVNAIKNLPITELQIQNTTLEVDIVDIPKSTKRLFAYNTGATGNISTLSTLPNLAYIDMGNCDLSGTINNVRGSSALETINLKNNRRLSGSAEAFFNAQIGIKEAGKTISLYADGTGITYNGESIKTGLKATYTASSYTVTPV